MGYHEKPKIVSDDRTVKRREIRLLRDLFRQAIRNDEEMPRDGLDRRTELGSLIGSLGIDGMTVTLIEDSAWARENGKYDGKGIDDAENQ